jgi:hypothetical protein
MQAANIAEREFGRDAQGHDPYAIRVKTCKIPAGRKSILFGVRVCRDCGKGSINGGPFGDLFPDDEGMWSAFDSAYRTEHPTSKRALEHRFVEIKSWLRPGESLLYPW